METIERTSTAEKPIQQDKKIQALKLLAQLTTRQTDSKDGKICVHAGIRLDEALSFIDDLQFARPKVTMWTKVERLGRKLTVIATSSEDFKSQSSKRHLQPIYITDFLEEPRYPAERTREARRATPYLVQLPNFDMFNFKENETITLSTTLRKKDLIKIIREKLGNVPENWSFNPRTTKPKLIPKLKI